MAFKKDSFQNDTFQIFTYGKALVGSILSSGAIVKRNIYKVLTSNVLFVENMIISKHCFRTLVGTSLKPYFIFRNAFSRFIFRKPKVLFNKEDK